jgi:prepilin-type processing-associated H-X9-DG protein
MRSDAFLRLHNEVIGWDASGYPITLKRGGSKIEGCIDGSSNTIAIIEDVGKNHETTWPFMRANYLDPPGSVDSAPEGRRNNYRWADPDNSNGISGPSRALAPGSKVAQVNNYNRPMGGPPECYWSVNNCGPNDEPFGFHGGGVLALFGDGHVTMIRDGTPPAILRYLADASDGQVIGDN